jgi:ADP-heptose:LPS heptosyltransferase
VIRDAPESQLIIHPGGLGDVLLAIPAIAFLRNRAPGEQMILLAGSEVGGLLQACGVVEETLTTESGDLASLMSGAEQLPVRLLKLLRRCNRVVGWLADHDGALRATLARLGIRWVALESPIPLTGVHQSARFLNVLKEPPASLAPQPRLAVPEELRQAGARLLRAAGVQQGQECVLCHPGSGSAHKCVRPEIITEVLRGFRLREITPVLVGGPADEAAIERIKELGVLDIPVIHNQNLATMAGILAQASVFVGHDSGLTHLAGALRIPTVAIFGPTDPAQWAPLGDHVAVVTGPACTCSGWELVRACDAKPCLVISPEEILAAASSVLRRYRKVTKT